MHYFISVEFTKGEDPHLLIAGTWNTAIPATLVLSPNAEVLVISHGSSISFYSTITGALDTTIENIFLGDYIRNPAQYIRFFYIIY
jgi:mRNA-capping enzyme